MLSYYLQRVIIGLDTVEMMIDIEISGPATIDFRVEELRDEDSDFEEVYIFLLHCRLLFQAVLLSP